MEVCQRCSHVFSSKSTLNRHMLSSRCGKLNSPPKYKCNECPYGTNLKNTMTKHISRCKYVYATQKTSELKTRLDELIKENELSKEKLEVAQELHKSEIEQLRAKIENLTKRNNLLKTENLDLKLQLEEKKGRIVVYKERPSTVNNNNTQYINPKLLSISCDTIAALTVENVKKEVDAGKYTYEDYIKGEIGLVNFIASLISSDDDQRNYVCTDTARNKFHRLIETREWKEDNGANFLNKIFDQLKEPATAYYHKINEMSLIPEARDTGDFLMDKTKRMFFGITSPKSKDRNALFNYIRTEVRKSAAV